MDLNPTQISYISVSYGLSYLLLKFWSKSNFKPFYLRHKITEVTGENTCMMIHPLKNTKINFDFVFDEFNKRFLALVPYDFWHLETEVILLLLNPNLTTN